MEIKISEQEINAGVVAYLNGRGFNLDVNSVKIEYTQGRKGAGLSAVLVEGAEVVHTTVLEQAVVDPATVAAATIVQPTLTQAEEKPAIVDSDEAEARAQRGLENLAAQADANGTADTQAQSGSSLFD